MMASSNTLLFVCSILQAISFCTAGVLPPMTDDQKQEIGNRPIVPRPWNDTAPFRPPPGQVINNGSSSRLYIAASSARWLNNILPYTIDSSFSSSDQATIIQAIMQIQSKSCIKFVDRTTEAAYVQIVNAQPGCFSDAIGYSNSAHTLNLQRATATNPLPCIFVSTIVHELLHVLGAEHEMNRPDRDDFVAIQWSNIVSGQAYQFYKTTLPGNTLSICNSNTQTTFDNCVDGRATVTTFGLPYDYQSVMHYSAYTSDPSFAKNLALPMITFRNTATPTTGSSFGNSVGMTDLDSQKLKAAYSCDTTTTAATKTTTKTTTTGTTTTGVQPPIAIQTVNGVRCITKYKLAKDGPDYRGCTLDGITSYIPYCATSIYPNGLMATKDDCDRMDNCFLPTIFNSNKVKCVAFSYKGVTYPAGSCAYLESYYQQPWCAITPNFNGFRGAAGQFNWDYCSYNCILSCY